MRNRVSDLTESLLRQRTDIEQIFPAGDGEMEFLGYYGGPNYFDDDCIYDPVDDATACWLLNEWLDEDKHVDVGWGCHEELSKLLAKRGFLVREKAESLVRRIVADEASFGSSMCLSFLSKMQDAEELAIRLLKIAPADRRDALFHACYQMNTPAIYEAVKANVRQWVAADVDWGNGTGEAWLVQRMVEKWDRTFPGGDHEDIREICRRAAGS